jgi:hypothetical protein
MDRLGEQEFNYCHFTSKSEAFSLSITWKILPAKE